MDPIPCINDLRDDERLVVEFDDIQCLGGPRKWVREIEGDDPHSVLIGTVGRMVFPTKKTIRLTEEQQGNVDEVLLTLSRCVRVNATSYQNFRVSLNRCGEAIASWEFAGVWPQ